MNKNNEVIEFKNGNISIFVDVDFRTDENILEAIENNLFWIDTYFCQVDFYTYTLYNFRRGLAYYLDTSDISALLQGKKARLLAHVPDADEKEIINNTFDLKEGV